MTGKTLHDHGGALTADARERLLITTNSDSLGFLQRDLDGALVEGVALRHVGLPAELAARVAKVTASASDEMAR